MSICSKRIKSLLDGSGMSYHDLEKLTGIKKSSLHRYASGTTAKIPIDAIEKLSVAFKTSREYISGWDDDERTLGSRLLNPEETALIELFRKVPMDRQQTVLQTLRIITMYHFDCDELAKKLNIIGR